MGNGLWRFLGVFMVVILLGASLVGLDPLSGGTGFIRRG